MSEQEDTISHKTPKDKRAGHVIDLTKLLKIGELGMSNSKIRADNVPNQFDEQKNKYQLSSNGEVDVVC